MRPDRRYLSVDCRYTQYGCDDAYQDKHLESMRSCLRKVSVVIVNCNGEKVLPDCLNSIENQDYPLKEIVVVDNKSTDHSKDICKDFKLLWLEQPDNLGLAAGYNRGAQETNGDLIFCINNDMRFEKDCISRLVDAIDSDDIFAADALHYNWEGDKVIHSAMRFHRDLFYVSFPIPFIKPDLSWLPDRMIEVPWGCAGALMMDRVKFEGLGGFDSSFFLYFEDADICSRAWMHGWKTIFVPSAIVYHMVGYDTEYFQRKYGSFKIRFSIEKNAQRFVLKTMGIREIFLNLCNRITHIIVAIFKRKLSLAWAIIYSSWANIMEMREILSQRKAIFKKAKLDGYQLLKRFIVNDK